MVAIIRCRIFVFQFGIQKFKDYFIQSYDFACSFVCVCVTWWLTLREERRLRLLQNKVLRIFGPKRDEVKGEWRKLHNEELNLSVILTQYFYGDKLRMI